MQMPPHQEKTQRVHFIWSGTIKYNILLVKNLISKSEVTLPLNPGHIVPKRDFDFCKENNPQG
jgi:hypothetical protein